MTVSIFNPQTTELFELVASYFKVLSEVSRLQILTCLREGPMNVGEISAATGLGQANLSKHLKVLAQAGILNREPKGVSAYYSIADPAIFQVCELVCDRISVRMQHQAEALSQLSNFTSK